LSWELVAIFVTGTVGKYCMPAENTGVELKNRAGRCKTGKYENRQGLDLQKMSVTEAGAGQQTGPPGRSRALRQFSIPLSCGNAGGSQTSKQG
jgi:hypothetical protein